jgi:hypothetical protein
VSTRIAFRSRAAISLTRPLPFYIAASHVEYRQVTRSTQALRYDSESFRITLGFALAIAHTLPEAPKEGERASSRIALPHEEGLYLGWTIPADKETFDFTDSSFFVTRDGQGETEAAKVGANEPPPGTALNVLTFCRLAELSGKQRDLYHAFKPCLENHDFVEGLKHELNLYAGFSRKEELTSAQARQHDAMRAAVKELLALPAWKTEAERPLKDSRNKTGPRRAPA